MMLAGVADALKARARAMAEADEVRWIDEATRIAAPSSLKLTDLLSAFVTPLLVCFVCLFSSYAFIWVGPAMIADEEFNATEEDATAIGLEEEAARFDEEEATLTHVVMSGCFFAFLSVFCVLLLSLFSACSTVELELETAAAAAAAERAGEGEEREREREGGAAIGDALSTCCDSAVSFCELSSSLLLLVLTARDRVFIVNGMKSGGEEREDEHSNRRGTKRKEGEEEEDGDGRDCFSCPPSFLRVFVAVCFCRVCMCVLYLCCLIALL